MTPTPELHQEAGPEIDPDDSAGIDEGALIEQAKVDRDAFGALYEIHFDKIFNYIFYRVGNRYDAEDLTAQVFMRALHHIQDFEYTGVPYSAWLYRIARNLLANWYRDTSRRRTIPIEKSRYDKVIDSPEQTTQLAEDKDVLLASVRRLPADRQELLIFKYVERMSNKEIGEIMGRSEGAIKSLYYRTLVALRDDLLDTIRIEDNG